ncbi:phosphatase PAP2 family protein [Nocardioides sp. cx-173]|uniref:phosphatase PAP2 family protein n=1 Tax=Nocardioides sp. cx-173 TaxID=2898796 RepID=UPI001E5AA6A3|nr:phosphatase PAP2 family protein [Nocardioides sp. cx-173]MCD4523332.1 phosphatase PAP2 family protein [Nocardioides sp. cx-173]UGB42328.1 phosphatase PAP2 family protein [Nocardioides sp. cx-173]
MYRRAYVTCIGTAAVMGILALIVSNHYDRPLLDPEGKFLGPSWARLPLLLVGAVVLDLLPRTLWLSRLRPSAMAGIVRERIRTHWNRERVTLVVVGVVSFYVTYVSYRNLKSCLPIARGDVEYDRELMYLDRVLFFGQDPPVVLHALLGETFSAHILSYIYVLFLPMVPLMLTAWLVWSRNISFGYWFATSQCLAWSLGTLSYYALPTKGPGFEYFSRYNDLTHTPTTDLMNSLASARIDVIHGGVTGIVQSVAGFASLHCAITLLFALMVQFTLRSRLLKAVFWANFAITVVATLYFGWHYLADDVAGIMIAFVSFYLGGLATGQRFDKRSLRSHPTTATSAIPVHPA